MELLKNQDGAVLSFGELLLRICPDADGHWLKENNLLFHVGGAELNVASALAQWNVPSKYFTALPANDLSDQILNYLQGKDIDVSVVQRSGQRMGLYFLTQGKDLKHDALIYDRAGSSFSELKPGMIDWDTVLDGVSWFHFSAICPAICQGVADVCKEGLAAASIKGITISVDLNYRARLWQYGKQPEEIMPDLLQHCNLVMGNVWSAETMLNIPVTPDISESGLKSIYQTASLKTSEAIMKQYPKCRVVANTFRFDSNNTVNYYTTLYNGSEFFNSTEYNAGQIVDKVGSGDCFMAGLIYGLYNHLSESETLAFATAAAYNKLFINGDATNQSVDAVKDSIKYE